MHPVFLQQWLSNEVFKAVGWTLIHSLWQGLLAALVAGIIIIGTKRGTARLRYNLLAGVFMLFLITVLLTLVRQLGTDHVDVKPPAGINQAILSSSVTIMDEETVTAPASTTIERFVNYFNNHADFYVLIWAIFFFVHCLKLIGGLAGIERIRNYRTHASPQEWIIKLEQLSRATGVTQTVRLLQSELVKVPVAIGIFKPVILLPLGLITHLPPEQVETILIHELAHVRRKDYLVNILQRFVEAVFFFNPALMWISSLMRQEREACCDDVVVANTNYKGNYLEALVSFQEYSLAGGGYAMGISSKKHYLLNRVKRMITNENKKLNFMEKILLVAGLVAFTAFSFIPKNDFRNQQKEQPAAVTVAKPGIAPQRSEAITVPAQEKPTKHPIMQKTLTLQTAATDVTDEPTLEVAVTMPPLDTVPGKSKGKVTYDQMKFPSVSSSINDDGKTKTETTTVTDQNGKNTAIQKENDKLIKLSVDGKNIPESEFGNYADLLDKIQMTMDENRARRGQEMVLRKVQRAMQAEEEMNRTNQKRLMSRYQNEQRQYLLKQSQLFKQSDRSIRSSKEEQRKIMQLMQK
jgi:beta-lactamase regulating signal transducer with metallopeptidase domain